MVMEEERGGGMDVGGADGELLDEIGGNLERICSGLVFSLKKK